MLAVFGATGHIGHELVSILSANGVPAVAVTRDPSRERPLSGIRWVKADLAVPASLPSILQGVTKVFLLTANAADMASLQRNAIRAAQAAGVEHTVKQSALGASDHSTSPIGKAHYEVEAALLGSGMAWTILRPHVFMQNLLDQVPTITHEGRIYAASGEGKIPFIDTRDIAAVAAAALTQPGHEGKKWVLTGPEALSYYDVARVLSDVVGRSVEYVDESPEEASTRLVRSGAPPWAVESMLALAAYQRAGGPTAVVRDTVARILDRPARSFAAFVRDHAAAFQGREGPGR